MAKAKSQSETKLKTPKVKRSSLRPNDYSLGERLKFLRETRKMTQKELGERSGLTQATIANLETGKKDPSIKTLEKISQALDIHVATLFSTDEVFVFDLVRLRRKYNDANKLTPHLYMALGRIIQYARDIKYI